MNRSYWTPEGVCRGLLPQADKEGSLKALEAAAKGLTDPEEVAHGQLYVRIATKALEKVRARCSLGLAEWLQVCVCAWASMSEKMSAGLLVLGAFAETPLLHM